MKQSKYIPILIHQFLKTLVTWTNQNMAHKKILLNTYLDFVSLISFSI
jgi:hypothetical protein